jgi:hypothetical protein
MKKITKTLSLDPWMVDAIQDMAKKERRSFTKQVEVLLESMFESKQDIADGKTQIDMEAIRGKTD